MSHLKLQIDLNAATVDGFTPARVTSKELARIKVGYIVTVFEPEDEVQGIAMVVGMDARYGLVYLNVNWATIDDVHQGDHLKIPSPGTRQESWAGVSGDAVVTNLGRHITMRNDAARLARPRGMQFVIKSEEIAS